MIKLSASLRLCVIMAFIFVIVTETAGQEPVFEDVTETAGLNPEKEGDHRATGQAWGDFDQDGWLDLYTTDTASQNHLYHNQQDGSFKPIAWESVTLDDHFSGGAVFADYDNDGYPDLYVLNWGENILLHNQQGSGFENVTEKAGVAGNANSQTASWGDFNQDGWLDLYVANWTCYPRCGRPTEGESDKLYQNNGDDTFTDVTRWLGTKYTGAGFVASFVDYDNDGDSDIYLVNDDFIYPIGNALWRNDGAGCDGWCFTEISADLNADTKQMGMGLATSDYDNDGDLDFYFTNAGPMTLLRNDGNIFTDIADQANVTANNDSGWGAVFFDYDNDGWQDIYVALMEAADTAPAPNPLYRNTQSSGFELVEYSGAADTNRTLGVAYADYDRNGTLDLVVGNREGYRLYKNNTSENNFLSIALEGAADINRDAIGTRITLTRTDGVTLMQETKSGSSLGAGNQLALHFGLEKASVKSLTIRWPNGTEESHQNITPNQHLTFTYGQETTYQQTNQPITNLTIYLPLTLIPITLLAVTFIRRKN